MTTSTDIEGFLDRVFAGDEPEAGETGAVVEVLRADAHARAYYDDLARLDEAVRGDFEARFGEAMFLDALDDVLAEEASSPPATAAANDNVPWAPIVAAAALALLALAPLFMPPTPAPQFQARTAATAELSAYEPVHFDVYCVERDGGNVSFRGPETFEFGTVRCPSNGELKLAAASTDERLRWGAFFGVESDGTLMWYGPSPAAPAAVEVARGERVSPIGETVRLEVNHALGAVRVVAVFSERPLEWPDVERIARRNALELQSGMIRIDGARVVRKTFEVIAP